MKVSFLKIGTGDLSTSVRDCALVAEEAPPGLLQDMFSMQCSSGA